MLTIAPSGINFWCMMPCQSPRLLTLPSLLSDSAGTLWLSVMMMTSTFRTAVYFWDCMETSGFVTCDNLTDRVQIIFFCVGKYNTVTYNHPKFWLLCICLYHLTIWVHSLLHLSHTVCAPQYCTGHLRTCDVTHTSWTRALFSWHTPYSAIH